MSSRCKSCGGSLIYDIELGKVKCEYCDSTYEPDEFHVKTAADESEGATYETKEFTCPQCGAQISSTEFDAIDYCMYCGSFVSLESQMKMLCMPDRILPFSKTKAACKAAYKKELRKKIYAPKEFRDDSFIDGFKGVYVPFWNYTYSYGPKVTLRGKSEERHGNYIHTQHIQTVCEVSGQLDNNSCDASSNFDDTISARIAPFPVEGMKEFNTSYMFGFYGDTADIGPEIYAHDADDEAKDKIWWDLTHRAETKGGSYEGSRPQSFDKDVQLQKSTSLVMLPIWFLTWRNKDRLAYSVVNGSTGEVYTEAPVSILRYLLFSLLTAIPIFFWLSIGTTFSAKDMLIYAMFFSVFMGIIYIFELEKLVRRVFHSDDRGFLERHKDAKEANDKHVSENLLTMLWDLLASFFKETGVLTILLIFGAIFLSFGTELIIGGIIILILIPIYSAYRLWKNVRILKDKTVFIDIAGIAFSLIYGSILLWIDPAPDYFFYFASMLGMAGVGFAAIRIMKRYNQLITRPLPHFFDKRKGGNAS